MKHRANLDLCVLTRDNRAIDKEGEVGADNFRDVEAQCASARSFRPLHTDGAVRIVLVRAVEIPEAQRERGGVFGRQRQEVLDEGVSAILIEEGGQRGIGCVLPRRDGVNGGEEVVPGKSQIVGQGRISGSCGPVSLRLWKKTAGNRCARVLDPRRIAGQGQVGARNRVAVQ